MSASDKKMNNPNSKAFLWLIALTFLYFIVFFTLLTNTKTCLPDTTSLEQWLQKLSFLFQGAVTSEQTFSQRFLSCLSMNELGDSLAGAFAPIAFLWLAGAVFIQSQELKAQREELTDTRAVMKEQVAETKASTLLFREQTEILKKEQLLREQKEADNEFDAKISVALAMCHDIEELSIYMLKSTKEKSEIQFTSTNADTIFSVKKRRHENFNDLLKEIIRGSIEALDIVESTPIKDGFLWSWSNNDHAKALSQCLKNLSQDNKQLSDGYKFKKKAMLIDEAYREFHQLEIFIAKKNIIVTAMNSK